MSRAPYPQAQIYEIESDLWREMARWRSNTPSPDDFSESDKFVALTYVLHAICVTAIAGALTRSSDPESYRSRMRREWASLMPAEDQEVLRRDRTQQLTQDSEGDPTSDAWEDE